MKKQKMYSRWQFEPGDFTVIRHEEITLEQKKEVEDIFSSLISSADKEKSAQTLTIGRVRVRTARESAKKARPKTRHENGQPRERLRSGRIGRRIRSSRGNRPREIAAMVTR